MANKELEKRIDRLRRAANVAAQNVQRISLIFLLVFLYVSVSVFSTTHEQLLRGSGAEYRDLLFPSFCIRAIMGQQEHTRERVTLQFALVCLAGCFPVLLLLLAIQVSYLPYHSPLLTWGHRAFVFVALGLLYQWPRILNPRLATRTEASEATWRRRWIRQLGILGWLGVALTIAYSSLFVAVIPGEQIYVLSRRVDVSPPRLPFGCQSLCLAERTLVEEAPSPQLLGGYYARGEPADAAWRDHARGLDLRRRDLRFADFRGARLVNADLRNADLRGANLDCADLQGANLRCAELASARLDYAQLQSANLRGAVLRGAHLVRAKLQDADLRYARLEGVELDAELEGADLGFAQLQLADLDHARLQGADLQSADLRGADLQGARLDGAVFDSASLRGADLRQASVVGARFPQSDLRLADLRDVSVDPLPAEAWAQLCELDGGGENGRERPSSALPLQRIEAARQRARNAPSPDFPSAQLDGAMHGGAAVFAPWSPPPDQADYHQQLAQYLGALCCEHPQIADRLVDRACEAYHQTDPMIQAFAVALARALLDKEREAAAPLSPETRARLEVLTISP